MGTKSKQFWRYPSRDFQFSMPHFEYKQQKITFHFQLTCPSTRVTITMPRFHNTASDLKSSSNASSSEAVSRQSSEGNSQFTANTIDASAPTSRKNAGTNDQDDFGIEEEYFASEFTFDYDTDDNNPAAPLWSNTERYGIDEAIETPKSILKDYSNSSQQQLHPGGSIVATSTSAEKKNHISFRKDVDFRQRTPPKTKKVKPKGSPKKKGTKRQLQNSPSNNSRGKKSSSVISTAPPVFPNSARQQNHSSTSVCSEDMSTVIQSPSLQVPRSSTATSNALPSWIPRRGVALDLRSLQSFVGDAIGNTFHNHMQNLLQNCFKEGMVPTILSTTAIKEPKSKTTGRINQQVMIEAKATQLDQGTLEAIYGHGADLGENEARTLWNELLAPLPIRPPSNVNNTNNRDAVHAPKRLLASDSWRIFGDLINAITAESVQDKSKAPLRITIITNDVALFTDTNIDSHKRAVIRLWDRLREHFDSGAILSLQIIVFQTGVDALQPSSSSSETSDPLDIPHRLQVVHVAKTVHNHISDLLVKEYKRMNGNCSQGSPMDVSFEMKDLHPIRLQSIIRDWKKEVMGSSSCTGSISFDLPETLDGTQCSIKLGLSYSILPYPLNSPTTEMMIQNLQMMQNAYFEVIQLVPLESIDLSLVYGVPLVAKAALDGDLEQFREMQKIVRELLRFARSRDIALALRCNYDGRDSPLAKSEVFIFMAQTNEEDTGLDQGMLYQYVSTGNNILKEEKQSRIDEASDDYANLIGTSLDFLEKKMLNPFETELNIYCSRDMPYNN